MANMDIAGLAPKYIFGVRTNVANNVHHISDEDIIYPVGAILLVHNTSAKRQKYIRLPDKGNNVTSLSVSPNKKYIAVIESGDFPTITIYDAATLKRRRVLQPLTDRGVTSKNIECVAFTVDSKNLLVIYGEPDWVMASFKYERGKLENFTRANNLNNTGSVRQIACNPNDVTVVVLVGDILFRMLAVNDNIWRQFGYSKAENLYLRSAAWLSQERLIAGTSDGRVMMVENGELKMVFKVEEVSLLNFQQRDDIQQISTTQLNVLSMSVIDLVLMDVSCIVVFPKGFVLECGIGKVYVFEKETPHRYKKRNVYKMEQELFGSALTTHIVPDEPVNKINGMSVSPSQDYLVVSCGIPQLFHVYLWGPDITKCPEMKFQELGPSLHRGAIQDMASCLWKPLLLTVGRDDRTLRVWNYETFDFLVAKSYQEDIYGVSLHPSGLYALVGFAGKLKFLTILIDDFAVTREFTIRYCSVCRFSTQGHLFAAANGNVIQIYSSITFENILNLKGHNGRITDISWTERDFRLLSGGTEGSVYEWDVQSGKRVVEVIVKTCVFTGVRITVDGRISYCVGSDGEIKEIVNGLVRTAHFVDAKGLDSMELSKSNQMMFVSGKQGNIFSIKLPLTEKKDHAEFIIHNFPVTKLLISFDDKNLISCSTDGSWCIWKLVNSMGKAIKIDKDYAPSVDILIPYRGLQDKLQLINDLNLRMHELDKEHAYQIRQIETAHTDKLEEVHEAYREVIETLKDKNNSLETEHVQEIHNINMDINKMKRNHNIALDDLEAMYNEKLIVEYNKYTELEGKILKIRREYEKQLTDVDETNKRNVDNIIETYKNMNEEKDNYIDELKEEILQNSKDHEIIKQQIEDDADREIYEMKTSHEAELLEEQTMNIKLRAENGIFQKKLNASVKEIEELKHTIFTLENDQIKFKNIINGLEKDIQELKKEILERDETIQGKERKIFELKKKTQELEKYKFVLDFNIAELKAQIEPRERKIYDQKEEISEMINELENLQKTIISLELQLAELREKLSASSNEFKHEQVKFRQACEVIKQMRTDLHHASGLIQDPHKLKIIIKEMFHKYNADKEFAITREEDCDSKNEFIKQRHYLEKTITGLKKAVSKRYDENEEKLKMMEESTELISEVNILRTQLKVEQKNNKQIESILGFTKKNMQPREAQRRLAEAIKSKEEIRKEYAHEMALDKTCIDELKSENIRLVKKIVDMENAAANTEDFQLPN